MLEIKSEVENVEKTIDALEHSIEKETATGSSSYIASWIKTLHEHKEFKAIADDLEKLKDAVADKDGKMIYTLLQKLGDATVEAAEKAEGKEGESIKKLGKALLKGSKFVEKLVGKEHK